MSVLQLHTALDPRPVILPVRDNACVSRARTILANVALGRSEEVTLWIDDDMLFDAADALKLVEACTEERPIVGAAYATKERHGAIVVDWLPDTNQVKFFADGGLYRVGAVGFGLTAVHRSVLEKMAESMPRTTISGKSLVPFFSDGRRGSEYVGEDFGFCRDASELGCSTWLDTRPRVMHVGSYEYGIEDTLAAVERVPSLTLELRRA